MGSRGVYVPKFGSVKFSVGLNVIQHAYTQMFE